MVLLVNIVRRLNAMIYFIYDVLRLFCYKIGLATHIFHAIFRNLRVLRFQNKLLKFAIIKLYTNYNYIKFFNITTCI